MSDNWLELNLTEEQDAEVREAAAIYKTAHLDTIDNVFKIARGIEILRKCHAYSGVKGSFAFALVQYKFTARDEPDKPIDASLRTALSQLLDHEDRVRQWWTTVPPRTKRNWLSAKAIYTHWKNSLQPKDGMPPKKPSPLVLERQTNSTLREQIDSALQEIKTLKNGDSRAHFDLEFDPPDAVGKAIINDWRQRPSAIRALIKVLQDGLRELERLHKIARPKKKTRRQIDA